MIRVFIVDDQFLIREGVKRLLSQANAIKIEGEAKNGESALREIGDIQPDIVLLDINLPDIDGLDVAKKISCKFPHIKIIILSGNEEESYVEKAVSVGAKGYLSKNVTSEELERAIELVYQGYSVIKPEVSKQPPLISYSSYYQPQAVTSARSLNEIKASGVINERGTIDRQSSKSVRRSPDVPLPELERQEIKTNLDGIENLLAKNNIQQRYVKYGRRRPKNRRLYNNKLAKLKKTVTSFEFGLLSLIILFSLSFLTMIALSK
jgi:DNA-binding NarL/FixJ family response regulator